ncbi:Calmodulin-regulated spectrin-associated protein 1 [Trichinella pseudospiralis]|uniref:Calmodulin-regulated spectrin-associated protein 1 n=1 Tax=Trichinella pseudospiralis TaxID=6337 RepID=A0A0V1F8U9_TRIPS|nr:Calmodulin-regulated spectrin-associated protein 1 [Trichinella pseudospiralis]
MRLNKVVSENRKLFYSKIKVITLMLTLALFAFVFLFNALQNCPFHGRMLFFVEFAVSSLKEMDKKSTPCQRGFYKPGDLLIEPVIEVVPMNEYNAVEAKLQASVQWLITKAFGKRIPERFENPFYITEKNQLQLKPALVNALANGELYAAVAATIFHDSSYANEGHKAVLQALQRLTFDLVDCDGQLLSETVLSQTSPLRTNSHIAMIDYLMTATVKDIVNIQMLTQSSRQYGDAQKDHSPKDAEGALLFWVNKICATVRDRVEQSQSSNASDAPIIPEMDDLYEDMCDGACIATVISFYRPEKLKFEDICFNDPMSMADCIHNLWLIREFCAHHLPHNVFHFSFEDLLYTHESLKTNLNVFLSELYYFFEQPHEFSAPIRRSIARVDPLYSQNFNRKLHPKENLSVIQNHDQSDSRLTSRMNSIDSLVTDRSVDSLKYTGFYKSSYEANRWGAQTERSSDMDKKKTVSFLEIQSRLNASSNLHGDEASPGGAENAKKVTSQQQYSRSDTMPPMKLVSGSTSSLIRMQLEEKRRQYEAQRFQRTSELARQRQELSKEAFFQLRQGDSPTTTNQGSNQTTTAIDAAAVRRFSGQLERNGRLPPSSPTPINSKLVEMSTSIQEIQEQMKRLSVEQEKLNRLMSNNANNSSSTVLNPIETGLIIQHTPLLTAQSLVCLPTNSGAVFSQICPKTEIVENEPAGTTGSTFRLHSDGEHISRLDPSLELTKSMTNWGMACRLVKRPRRTWAEHASGSSGSTNQMPNCAASMLNLPVCQEQSINGGGGINGISEQQQHVVSKLNISNLEKAEEVEEQEEQEKQQQQQLNNSVDNFLSNSSSNAALSKLGNSHCQITDEREGSPGIGFVIAAENGCSDEDELYRRKEQRLANVLRRREEMELRKARMEAVNAERRAMVLKKMEDDERRRRERELNRQRILEEYQKRKAEQEALEQSGNLNSSYTTLPPAPSRRRLARGQSQPAGRPKSQIVSSNRPSSASTATIANSVTNIDTLANNIESPSSAESALKLFVKPTHKSNRSIVFNAIQHSVLVGSVNDETKRKVLQELAKSDSKHFLIMFRDQKCQFRALYSWDQASDTVHKLYGTGPKSCSEKMMNLLLKYDSGAKQFSSIPSRHLSATIDAFTLKEDYWPKKSTFASTPRR